MMASETQLLVVLLIVTAVWQIGFGAGAAAVFYIRRPLARARERVLLSALVAGVMPAVTIAVAATMESPFEAGPIAAAFAIVLVVGGLTALPGAAYVTSRLDRARNVSSPFE